MGRGKDWLKRRNGVRGRGGSVTLSILRQKVTVVASDGKNTWGDDKVERSRVTEVMEE